jgi:zinc transporter 1/2/3
MHTTGEHLSLSQSENFIMGRLSNLKFYDQAEYGMKMKSILVFFFSVTTPFGIALGIGLSNIYTENSPAALIVEGVLNAASAGLLNYMALVDLLASEFMGPKLQGSLKLQMWACTAVLLGAGAMSLMAKWA